MFNLNDSFYDIETIKMGIRKHGLGQHTELIQNGAAHWRSKIWREPQHATSFGNVMFNKHRLAIQIAPNNYIPACSQKSIAPTKMDMWS